MTEEEAQTLLRRYRWPPDGNPICPRCQSRNHYVWRRKRLQFKCRDCHHQYTITSGTAFACRKLSYIKLIAIIEALAARKHQSLLSISRALDVQYKTLWVLARKLDAVQSGRDPSIWVGYWQPRR